MDANTIYNQSLSLTGDPLAAAILTLAKVIGNQPAQPLTARQAAEVLNIAPRTIYDLCKTGRLRHHRIGTGRGGIRIMQADVEEYRTAAEPKPAVFRYLDATR